MVPSADVVCSRSWGSSRRFVLEAPFQLGIEGLFRSSESFTVMPEPSFYLGSFSKLMVVAIPLLEPIRRPRKS